MRRYKKGWTQESERHSLAAHGIKTGKKSLHQFGLIGLGIAGVAGYEIAKHHHKKHLHVDGMLPVYKIGGKLYFRDDRLGEYRNIENPNDVMLIENVPLSKLQRPTKADSEKVFGKEFIAAKGNKVNFYAQRIERGRGLLGSSNQLIVTDLRTLNGMVNRLKRASYPSGYWDIYRYENIFDNKTYEKVASKVYVR